MKKILSVLTLIVLVGSDFLTSVSYALDDMLEDSVVVQTEVGEEPEEQNTDEESRDAVYEDESIEEENEAENSAGDIVEEGTGEVSEIGSGEVEELTEETVEGVTGDIAEELTWDVEELTGTVDENTGTGEDVVFEDITYNEAPIIGEKTYNDVTVRVEALTGIFPEGTEVIIEPIKWGSLSSLKDKLVEEKEEIKEDTTIVAFDITFRYEGEEVQPKDGEKVQVTFDYSRNKDLLKADKNDNQEVKVYHLEDKDEEGNKVALGEEKVVDVTNKEENKKEGIVVTDADSFSIYVLTLSSNDSLIVTLNPNGGTFVEDSNITITCDQENQAECLGTIEANNEGVVSRPVDPVSDKGTLEGWYTDQGLTQAFNFNDPITDNITLYAKWTCNEGYVTLIGNGGVDMNCFEYGTISYEDNNGNEHVLMDRNLGAEMIGFLYDADSKSYGYYYQWGNNYGFGPSITPITSNTQVDCTNIDSSTYSSSTFIMGSNDFDWCSSRNDNLWGGSGDDSSNNRGLDTISITATDRQGPCPEGWHVPSIGERQTLLIYWASGNSVTRKSGTPFDYYVPAYVGDSSNFNKFKAEFKIPIAGKISYMVAQLISNGGGGSANLWSSSSDINMRARYFNLSMNSKEVSANGRDNRAHGMPVRCFKNDVKITYDGNGGTPDTGSDFGKPGDEITLPGATQQGKVFGGWNNETGYVGTQGDKYTLTRTETLLAQRYDYLVTFVYGNGRRAADPIFVNDGDGAIILPLISSVTGYNFDGWYDATGNKIGDAGDSLSVNESKTLYAQGHYNSVELVYDNTTTTVGSDDEVEGLPMIMTVTENTISEVNGQKLAGELNIDFGGEDAKFSHLVKVKIPVEGSSKAYVKVKHVGSDEYNFDGLTSNIWASCDNGDIVDTDDMYDGAYINVESGYVSIYTCEASSFAAFGLPKVTFEPNNGDEPTTVEVESGDTVDNVDIPNVSNSGYNFSGWYIDDETFQDEFDFDTPITGDITLYAKWQGDVTYTVTFDANRGTFADTPASQNVSGGEYVTDPATLSGYKEPELPGYTFTGWWTEPRGGTQWDFGNDLVTGNITLYAHWIYDLPYGDLDVYMIDSSGSLIKYVMMDRNMGATGVYNKDFDSQNPSSFGFVYQWGNNYGFPRCNGNGTCNYSPITDTQVSVDIVENYIPSKFASSTWIGKNGSNGSQRSWYVSDNTLNHLWGNANTTDRQGPCPDGYHVPLTSETNDEGGLFRVWGNVYDKTINRIEGNGSGFSFLSDDQKLFTFQFLLPNAGAHKKGNTKEQEQNICGDYWTATPAGSEMARNMWFCKDGQSDFYKKHGNFLFTNNSQRNNGSTLRCFKNSTGSANLDIVNGGKKGLITVHKVDGVVTINAIKEPENTDANGTGLIFGGWYTSQNFEPSTMKTGGDTLSASVTTLYAKWDCPDGLVYNSDNECISGVLVRFMDEEMEYTRSVVLSGEEVRAPATNPEKAGYIFTGWFESGANLPFVFTGTPITGNLDLYAHWDVNNNKYDVNVSVITGDEDKGYLSGMGSTGISLTGLYNYGTELVFIAVPKLGYVFDYWMNGDQVLSGTDLGDGRNQLTIFVDQVLDIIAFFKETPTPYTVEHYQENLGQTGYDFVWSGTMYGIANEQTNVTGTNYTGFILSGDLASYQTGINSDGSTVVRLYYNRGALHTVTFENWNGDFLWSGKVASGETPTYNGSTPSRVSTEQNVYTFDGWYPELSPVTGDITYTAVYTESPRLYTVTLTGTPAGYGTLTPESLSKEYGAAIVISGDKLTVGGTEVTLTGNEGYDFQEWTGTCGKVDKQVCDEHIIYSHSDSIEFTGGNNLIITNPGYDLFSESNYLKDFEISFDIVDQNLSSSVSQATILNVKDEDQSDVYPGIAIRKSSSAGKIEITATSNYGKGYKTNKNYSLENLHSIKISRINSILYVSINGSENEQLYDYSGFNAYFTKPIVFGSSYKDEDHLLRPAKITLSNILIKSIDTCYTGNVYVVTGDCQMTAVFSASDEYPVTIESNNAEYGTVSSDSVTKPYGTTIIESGNTLNIGGTIVTATTGTAPTGHTYTFSGWTFSSECESGGNYVVAEGCAITGNFEDILNTYTVTFDVGSGTTVENQTYYYDEILSGLDSVVTTREGYTFSGWYLSGVLYTSGSTMPAEDITLIAVWDINKYDVSANVATGDEGYLSGMGNTGISLTGLYDYGTELVFIAIPELGYVFDYWKNGDTVLSGTDLGDGTNQLTVVVNQILDIIAFFKPAENTPYTVEHYKQNLDQTGYEFAWSGTMYGTTNAPTNATGTDYEGFTLSGNLVDYQTGIKADGSTVVKLYYNRNVYTITWNNWNGSGITTTPAVYGAHPEFARDGWPQRYRADDEVQYLFIFTGWSRSGSSEIIRELTGLTTEIVTGDTTYIAQYDQTYRSFEVRYHPNGGTGNMENQTFQLYTSGVLNLNNFVRTGYEFDGWLYYYADDATGFYENGQTINVEKDYVKGDRERELGLLYFDLYAQWKPSTDVKVTVNYYLKDLDADNNVLTGGKTEYVTGVEFTGIADSIVNSIFEKYGTGIEGYEYSKSIVYGSDLGPDGIVTGTTTILADGSRVIDMYYVPRMYQFTLNSGSHLSTVGSSATSGYYYGANVRLSGDSNDDCFTWSGWTTSGITLSDNTVKRTSFTMPANDVEATPSTTENTYNIIFNGNGNTSGTMSPMNGVKCTESTGLTINTFGKTGHTFTGWSTTVGGSREYIDGATVDRLSTGADVNLYAVWDINKYNVNASVAAGDHGSLQWSGAGIYEFGETLVIIAVPELGYLLDYWEINGETELPEGATTGENQLNIVVNQILDIVAHFKENVGTVTVNYYEMNTGGTYSGTTSFSTFTGLVGYTGYAILNPSYGFHLDTERTANTGIVISDNDAENVIDIYYARDKNHVIILYTGDFEGESLSFGSTVVINPILRERYYYGEHVYFEATPNTGYAFKSWTYSGDRQETISMNQREISFDMGTGEVWLTLDGDIINYYIYYNLDGGIENPERPKNRTGYTVRDYSFEIYDPIKTGYIFLGWTGGINGSGISTPVSGLIVNVASGVGDMSYYANWEQKPYIVNVTIEPENGGTVGGTGEYHYGDPISLIATPNVDSGYQFTGWYVGYDKISDYYSYGFQADDSGGTGLVAKFELRNHYLEVTPNDWTKGYYYPEYRNYYQYGTVVPVYATPNPGYQIRGWRWSEGGDYITTGEDNHIYTGLNLDVRIIRDTSIRLEFEPEIYNVTYMDNDEVLSLTPSTYSVENHLCSDRFEGCMQILPEYSKDGYDFTGWYWNPWVSQESKVERISSIGGVTVYAGMIPTTYRVNYHLGSGETLPWWYVDNFDEYTIESGRTYLPEPEKQGYNFLGWKDSNNHVITGYGGGMTGNIDLYPIWTGKEMNIEVRYHEMDTNGQYPREWSSIYYTGLTASTFIVPDYTHTGFSQDRANYPYQPSSIVVSGNDYANVVDVYYKRETYWLNTFGIKRLLPEIDSGVIFAEVIPNKQASGNRYYFGEEITVNLLFNDGWNFTGWYDATDEGMGFPPEEVSDLTARNISFHMPAHNVKVEPLMEHILYTLSFTGYEGSDVLENYPGVEDQEIYFGYHAYLPYLNKSGYWFNGWKDEYGNYEWRTGEPYPIQPILQRMPAHDYELIADFSPRTDMSYAEYYYLQDIEGSGYTLSGDLTTWWLDGVTEQLIPKRYSTVSGFDLPRYWIDGQDLPYDSIGPVIKATGDNFINYYYDRLTYLVDVNYDSSKMLITGTGEYRYDAPVTLTAIVNTGYEFSGFVSERLEYSTTGSTLSFRVPYDFVSGYPSILYAYARPIEYSIEYELNKGESYYSYPTGYTIEDESIYLSDPYKDGYTFLGWTGGVISGEQLSELTKNLEIPHGSIGDRKYYANWEPDEVNVTVNYYLKKIDAKNNELLDESEFLTGKMFTGLTDDVVNISEVYGIDIEGYEYTTAIVYGSDLSGGVETGTTTVLLGRSIDIYYTPIKYDFTVVVGPNTTTSGTSISTGYYYGAYVTLSGDSTDDCFEWDKWGSTTLSEGKNQQHTTFEMPAHDVVVESMVAEKSYDITFNANGGTGTMATLPVQCTSGTLIANSFERDGYTFTGWSRNAEGPVEFTGGTDIYRLSTESGGSVTLFAIWDANWYTVIFDLSGGSLTGDMTLTTGYTIETPAISLENYIPVRNGYTFTGWYKGETLINSIAGGETGNYTLIAKWKAILYTVSFDSASGTFVENQTYYYNDYLLGLDSAVTTRTGYDFDGWYLSGVLYTSGSTMPAEDITLIAKWTPCTGVQYQVNHRGENIAGTGYDVELSGYTMYGTSNTQTIAESGDFVGFTLSGNVVQENINPDGTTVVNIYYNRNEYTITLDNNGGTGITEITGKYEAPLIVPNPSKSGYEFVGWNPGLPTTIPSYNYTGMAMWNPSTGEYKVEFYYQLSDGTYPLIATSGELRTGITEGTGSVTDADKEPIMSGYTFDSTNTGNVLEGEIVGDGSLILKVYFKKQFMVRYLTGLYGKFEIETYEGLDYGIETPVFGGSTGSHESGYTFIGWTPDLAETVIGDVDYIAQWVADSDTLYSVEYYKENLSGGYDVWTGIYTGETDVKVVALVKDFTGFTFSGKNENNVTSGVIAGDGSLVLKLFYDRNKYTITWKDGDSETLKTEQVFYGVMPVYSGSTPSKTATAQYTYTFNDTWSPNIESVTTGATYVAQFEATLNEYEIIFKDGDGNVIQSGMVAYGTTPAYSGATPSKTATAQYTYTFNDTWSLEIQSVTTGATYVAQFDATVNEYEIIFKDGDGNVIQSGMVAYGTTPAYSGAIPSKTATAQYTYTFNDTWSPNIDSVTTGATYIAQFDETINEYEIIFKDGDGNVIQSGMVAYGQTPAYSGTTPSKTATAQYTYTFNDTWSPNIDSVTTGATYIAQFDSSINSYTINIESNDTDMGTISTGEINVEYGATIVESGNKITIGGVEIEATPNPADVQYTYEFDSWTNTCGSELVGACTIQAKFKKTLNKYTITWRNEDGSLIDTTMVAYGTVPTHANPVKPSTEDYKYTFVGWEPSVVAVVGDAEYTAVFTEEEKDEPSKGGGMSGGGGRRLNSTDLDDQHGSAEESSGEFTGDIITGDVTTGNVDKEMLSLYQWARENNITTMDTLQEANPDGPLTRGHMAKMVVNFAQNVLGWYIPTSYPDKCNWNDKESERESLEIKMYAKKSCAIGVMGIYVEEFMPNKILDRAEFGTIISRLLWGDRYNIVDTDHRLYYEDHLQVLKDNGILTQIENPEARREIRKWVWLVFRRIAEKQKK